MNRFGQQRHQKQKGFSLVEVMVGMIIGMLGIIIMLQLFSIFEGQKRTTTGGSDAQTTGAIALYELEHDIKQAGYGISTFNIIGCNMTLPSGITLNSLAPVTINYPTITGNDANTDTLLIASAGTTDQTEGDSITAQVITNSYSVGNSTAFNPGDVVVAEPANLLVTPPAIRPACTLTMTTVTGTADPNVAVVTGFSGMKDGLLYNLGRPEHIRINAYAVRNRNLTVCDYMANDCGDASKVNDPQVWQRIANNVVSLKAVYGTDTSAPMDGIVDGPSTALPAAVTPQCALVRVGAIGVALVVRNSQFNKEVVTNTAANAPAPDNTPTWLGNAINPILGSAATALGPGTSADEPWKHYRYKVFQTIAPLRNINWQGVITGC